MRRIVLVGLCLVSMGMLLFPAPSPHGQAQTPAIPLPIADIGTRPRLLITPTYIEQTLKPRATDANPQWVNFRNYLDSPAAIDDIQNRPAMAARSFALGWLITDDSRYREYALDAIQRLVNQIENAPVITQVEAHWDAAFVEAVGALAIGYDWMYGALSLSDRNILAETLLKAANRLQDPTKDIGMVWVEDTNAVSGYVFRAFGYEDSAWLFALTATAFALEAQDLRALNLIPYVRELWTTYSVPALALFTEGAWLEGVYYGFKGGWYKVQTALLWWTAKGENYFDDSPWWYQRLGYNLFTQYPLIEGQSPDSIDYPMAFGAGYPNQTDSAFGRAQSLMLQAIFAGNAYADWSEWVFETTPAPSWLTVEDFLWRSPDRRGELPSPLTWRTFGSNHVFMRGNWQTVDGTSNQEVVGITFHAGDNFSPRQFFDQGSFTIWREGDELISHGGVYQGGGSWHEANYYFRTVGGNTLRICDLVESFDGIYPYQDTPENTWLNDCGQRATLPDGGVNADLWRANELIFDTSDIIRIKDEGDLTYIQADLTAAYNSAFYTTNGNSPKVESVIREVVFLRPEVLLVHDRILPSRPEFTIIHTLHFNTQPTYDSIRWIVQGELSTLYLQHLTPNVEYKLQTGFQVAGLAVDTAFGVSVLDRIGQTGHFQLDTIAPPTDNPRWFLSVYHILDQTALEPPYTPLISGESMRGTVVTSGDITWQVLFDDDPLDVTSAQFVVNPVVEFLVITGLAPAGVYDIVGENNITQQFTADGAGVIVVAFPPTGLLTLQRGR